MVNFGANVQVRRERLHHYFVQCYTVAGGSYCCGPMKCWGNPNIEKSLERTLRLLSNLRTGLEVVINSCLKLVLKQVRRVGLVRDDIRQAVNGIPGLTKIPVLGTLFRSRDFVRNESELVIIITPYLARPVARNELAKPDDNFNAASDGAAMFLGRVNRVYGTMQTDKPAGRYHGVIGFIYK